jgi:hypothetical protein
MTTKTRPTMRCSPAITLWLQSGVVVGRVAELGRSLRRRRRANNIQRCSRSLADPGVWNRGPVFGIDYTSGEAHSRRHLACVVRDHRFHLVCWRVFGSESFASTAAFTAQPTGALDVRHCCFRDSRARRWSRVHVHAMTTRPNRMQRTPRLRLGFKPDISGAGSPSRNVRHLGDSCHTAPIVVLPSTRRGHCRTECHTLAHVRSR